MTHQRPVRHDMKDRISAADDAAFGVNKAGRPDDAHVLLSIHGLLLPDAVRLADRRRAVVTGISASNVKSSGCFAANLGLAVRHERIGMSAPASCVSSLRRRAGAFDIVSTMAYIPSWF